MAPGSSEPFESFSMTCLALPYFATQFLIFIVETKNPIRHRKTKQPASTVISVWFAACQWFLIFVLKRSLETSSLYSSSSQTFIWTANWTQGQSQSFIFLMQIHMNFVSLYMDHALLKGQFRLTNSQWKKKSYIVKTYIPAL